MADGISSTVIRIEKNTRSRSTVYHHTLVVLHKGTCDKCGTHVDREYTYILSDDEILKGEKHVSGFCRGLASACCWNKTMTLLSNEPENKGAKIGVVTWIG